MTKVDTKLTSDSLSFEGWNFIDFIKGRKKLLIDVIGGIAGYVATQNPAIAAITMAAADVLYGLLEYFCKKY